LELVCILQDERALKIVQQACEREFERLWREHQNDIEDLLPLIQEKFKELRRRGGTAAPESISSADTIEIRKETPHWDHHLFVDNRGKFGWNAGSWEKPVLEIEIKRTGFAGFLRNMSRKPWALCVPYGAENDQALYPDLLIFRRHRGKVVIDILDPHGDQFADHLPKAQGLARYAKQHGEHFERIQMIRLVKDKPERLDMQDEKVRAKVLKATTVEQVKDLYTELG